MGTTEKVAKWIVEFDYDKLPPNAIENVKNSVLDTLGTALVGAKGPIGPILNELVEEMGGNPQARVIGSGVKTTVLNAVLANGTFAHADDYDDVGGFGHPGVVLIPIILALGEQLKFSGKKAIEAYAVGFEVGNRMRALGSIEYEAGFHGTCLMGTIGATAEAAKLLGLNVDQTRAALGIAASLASGIMQNFGMDAKALHAGHAAHNGILAASLAKKGFTGDPDVFEGPRGFFYVYGQENGDIKRVTENLGKVLAIETPTIIKFWPCGLGGHGPLTAIFQMIDKYNLKPDQIASVDVVKSGPAEAGGYLRHNPRHGVEGKFSSEYQIATALVDRKIDVHSFTDEKLARPIIQELIKKVTVRQDPAQKELPQRIQGDTQFIVVTVKLNDGRVLEERNMPPKTLKGEEIYNKYRGSTQYYGIPADKAEHTIELVKGLENLQDITELMDTVVK